MLILNYADLRNGDLKGAKFYNTTMPDGRKYTGRGENYRGPRFKDIFNKSEDI